jgi:hypothetical protein
VQEEAKLRQAMKNKEFRNLLDDYMKEISDPKSKQVLTTGGSWNQRVTRSRVCMGTGIRAVLGSVGARGQSAECCSGGLSADETDSRLLCEMPDHW